jgi:hypothetical protein
MRIYPDAKTVGIELLNIDPGREVRIAQRQPDAADAVGLGGGRFVSSPSAAWLASGNACRVAET